MAIRIQSTCVDSAGPRALASFWEAVLGWRRTYDSDDEVGLEPPATWVVLADPEGNEFCILRALSDATMSAPNGLHRTSRTNRFRQRRGQHLGRTTPSELPEHVIVCHYAPA